MSSDNHRRQIESLNRELGQLHQKLARERKNESDKVSRIGSIERSINQNTSSGILQSKLRDIDRLNRDIERSKKQQADLTKKIADKESKKHTQEKNLLREQKREQDRLFRQQEKELAGYRSQLSKVLSESEQGSLTLTNQQNNKTHDVFISHASEDKESFVHLLAESLTAKGIDVWYDETVLTVGDSLRRSIDKGLASSRYGIVVLSTSFFSKNWPQYELDGLVTRETSSGNKVILPIWHKVSKDEVASYSPTLADKVALNTGILSLDEIVRQLVEVIQPVPTTSKEDAGSE
ncbi:TIR domain protein [Gimesia panareensis]|uniref:ADP-ribosyl cyclase/cyclic ADP-ribose hydrolase n=1 Tax=Gimesia panareensis TaxID=2527978 RepID=A0A517QE60_9PLAN|nr:toll/interleukin-1 receptor domain-containing protein [Gimesia panareensis]QDT29884.1 TIR domain protein [Gimesia panareensis]